MNTGNKVGVAISTTGDEHRMGFLTQAITHWRRHLGFGAVIVVTVDGDAYAFACAAAAFDAAEGDGGVVVRVGQPGSDYKTFNHRLLAPAPRLGVAANKNTGIEILMDYGVDHLFLSDDDTWPVHSWGPREHLAMNQPHSMVCWGRHRLDNVVHGVDVRYAGWSWPRGVMLYVRREVIEAVGGMDERFGPGGHEHVEFSRRIHQAGFTPAPYLSPLAYASPTGLDRLWHCEDRARPGEPLGNLRQRRKQITSVRRVESDWPEIEKIMAERDGDTSFVPYRAADNGRGSATLYAVQAGRGAAGTGRADA